MEIIPVFFNYLFEITLQNFGFAAFFLFPKFLKPVLLFVSKIYLTRNERIPDFKKIKHFKDGDLYENKYICQKNFEN
ncbi:hypothetical protein B0A66_14280 [Flavobacterium hercynium]|uniref:Uncharacterized protein n=1 Tax=Flavobacterium hercynium TaxID=387094 RepID=A0A226H617_9FLAO|nr:hypothetical protein B0A66_14280 [Flavobacterium hercynium]